MNHIIQNLIAVITGFLSNLTTTAKNNLVAAINEVNAKPDTNFANNNLTADADRAHDFAGHKVDLNNLSEFNIKGTNTLTTVPFVSDPPTTNFVRNADGYDRIMVPNNINDPTITAILNIDGTNTSPITYTFSSTNARFTMYIGIVTPGTSVTCVSYTANVPNTLSVEIDVADIGAYDGTKKVAIFDGKLLKKETITLPVNTNFAENDLNFSGNRFHNVSDHSLTLVASDYSGPTINSSKGLSAAIAFMNSDNTTDVALISTEFDSSTEPFIQLLNSNSSDHPGAGGVNATHTTVKVFKDLIEFKRTDNYATRNTLDLIILFIKLPIYDTEAAAVTAGLVQDQVYKTTTGELRIKL